MRPPKKTPETGAASADATRIRALNILFAETVSLFHRLKQVSEEVHHLGELSGGMRGVLRNLAGEPHTVPQLARMRPVSRQHIQTIVNSLKERGLVEMMENPAHKRSRLVGLTDAGRAFVARMNSTEGELLSALGIDISEARLHQASDTLRDVRKMFEGERWREVLAEAD